MARQRGGAQTRLSCVLDSGTAFIKVQLQKNSNKRIKEKLFPVSLTKERNLTLEEILQGGKKKVVAQVGIREYLRVKKPLLKLRDGGQRRGQKELWLAVLSDTTLKARERAGKAKKEGTVSSLSFGW